MNVSGLVRAVLAQVSDDQVAKGLIAAMAGMWLLMMAVGLAMIAFVVYCYWRIFTKTGHGGAYAFLMFIPGFGPLIVLLMLAFGEWPALRGRA